MIGAYWWNSRHARQAARQLRRGLSLVDAASTACDAREDVDPASVAALQRAAGQVKLARRTIEELPELSFTTQSRFFRLFEWLEECMDYATESIRYEEFEAAQTDLCRSRRGIRDAVTLLSTSTGIKAPRLMSKSTAAKPAPATPPVAEKPHAQIIHLLPTPACPGAPAERPQALLM